MSDIYIISPKCLWRKPGDFHRFRVWSSGEFPSKEDMYPPDHDDRCGTKVEESSTKPILKQLEK